MFLAFWVFRDILCVHGFVNGVFRDFLKVCSLFRDFSSVFRNFVILYGVFRDFVILYGLFRDFRMCFWKDFRLIDVSVN